MAEGDERAAHHARPGLLLQPRGMLDRRRATQGQAAAGRRAAEAAGRGAGPARLVAGRRAEAQADSACAASACIMRACCRSIAASSRNCSSGSCCPCASAPRRWRPASTCRPDRSWCRRCMKGPPGKKKLIDAEHGPSDFGRAGRPQFDNAGLRLRPGPRGRREDRPLAGEVRPDPRGHERPRPAEGEEGI